MEKNLTTGSVFKTILYFALPYLFSYFLQTLYGMADLFIIGQFNGTESTTAVANGSQVMHMLTVMIVGLAMGSTVIIGRAVGARHKDEIAKTESPSRRRAKMPETFSSKSFSFRFVSIFCSLLRLLL